MKAFKDQYMIIQEKNKELRDENKQVNDKLNECM